MQADGAVYSGRILDVASYIDGSGSAHVFLATATGGLWRYDDDTSSLTPLTDQLPSLAIGTVALDPNDPSKILIGTGEHWVRGGSEIYRSTDGGANWVQTSYPAGAQTPHRIRYANSQKVYVAANNGIVISTNGGTSWDWRVSGCHFDLAIHPTNPNIVYTTWWDLYTLTYAVATFDGGLTWSTISSPVPNTVRGSIAVSASNPNILYAAYSGNPPDWAFAGAYKSTNGGTTWNLVLAPAGNNYMGKQSWYDNVVAISPTDPNAVFLCGVGMKFSSNGGTSWIDIDSGSTNGLHSDYHAFGWLASPANARSDASVSSALANRGGGVGLIGHDGGWSVLNGGFTTALNRLPITQYTHLHAAQEDLSVLGGGSQDNGISITTDGGSSWYYRQGGDGSTLSIDPNDTARMWLVNGVWNGPLTFRRARSTDRGINWTYLDTGIDPSDQWYTELHNDQVDPVWLYTNAGSKVYLSQDYGDVWTSIGTFPANVRSLRVSRYAAPSASVWAVADLTTAGNRVFVYDGSTWSSVETGLPADVTIRCVIPHPREAETAFALINGTGTPGQKLYRTQDRGLTWINVTGDLPDVPLGGVVAHPTNSNLLYLGTEMGCFQGKFNGSAWKWSRWNAGLPEAAIAADMAWTDLLGETGEFWITLGTYGRSIYRREVQDVEPAAVSEFSKPRIALSQNAPNPVRRGETTRIRFSTPKSGTVHLGVYDVSGREVAKLVDGWVDSGDHQYEVESTGFAPGIYFCRLSAGGYSDSRKMTIQ